MNRPEAGTHGWSRSSWMPFRMAVRVNREIVTKPGSGSGNDTCVGTRSSPAPSCGPSIVARSGAAHPSPARAGRGCRSCATWSGSCGRPRAATGGRTQPSFARAAAPSRANARVDQHDHFAVITPGRSGGGAGSRCRCGPSSPAGRSSSRSAARAHLVLRRRPADSGTPAGPATSSSPHPSSPRRTAGPGSARAGVPPTAGPARNPARSWRPTQRPWHPRARRRSPRRPPAVTPSPAPVRTRPGPPRTRPAAAPLSASPGRPGRCAGGPAPPDARTAPAAPCASSDPTRRRRRMPGWRRPLHQYDRNRQLRRSGVLAGGRHTGVPVRGGRQPVAPGRRQPVRPCPVLARQVARQPHGRPRAPRLDRFPRPAGRPRSSTRWSVRPSRPPAPHPCGSSRPRPCRVPAAPPADHPARPVDLAPGRHGLGIAPQGHGGYPRFPGRLRHPHAARARTIASTRACHRSVDMCPHGVP